MKVFRSLTSLVRYLPFATRNQGVLFLKQRRTPSIDSSTPRESSMRRFLMILLRSLGAGCEY
jgi:hypothetical protein